MQRISHASFPHLLLERRILGANVEIWGLDTYNLAVGEGFERLEAFRATHAAFPFATVPSFAVYASCTIVRRTK